MNSPCDYVLVRLDDYVDDALTSHERAECDAHLKQCAACAEELGGLRDLLDRARALPKSIEPKRDLWLTVAGRINGNVAEFPESRNPRKFALRFAQVAAAAALVFAGLLLASRQEPAETPISDERPFTQVEQEYLKAREDLLAELYADSASLPPGAIATVEENLRIIDSAVSEIRVALADDPDNPQLERMLVATFKSQVDLLQQAVYLAHES